MTALIGMSGGVDSSTAALLMKSRGYECRGASLKLHREGQGSDTAKCGSEKEIQDAARVAERLGMPFCVLDHTEEFRKVIMDNFVRVYESGWTPNPCIICNRNMKFRKLIEHADSLGIRYVVTGHYARVYQDADTGRFILKKGLDEVKDQSYFLSLLTQEQLSRIQFPLGEMTKEAVRDIAAENGLFNAGKRDSQDICFVPDGDYVRFMESYTGKKYPEGDFLDMSGKVVGRHQGAVGYTIGQRRGLDLAMGHRIYVCDKDMEKNTVTIGENSDLYSAGLTACDINWVSLPGLEEPMRIKAKTRSRQKEESATVYPDGENIRVIFDEPQRAITPGQTVVMYDGDAVVGGGTITGVVK